jgi:hypothetical protein
LPTAAARQVVRSLLNARLAEEVPAAIDDAGYVWRQGDDGSDLVLRATDLGLARLRAEDGTSLAPPTAATLIEPGVGADDAASLEQPVACDTLVDESQQGLDATQAPRQPAAVTPTAAEPADAVRAPPLVLTRLARQSRLRQAAQALLAAWEASVSADALDEHFAGLRAALAMQASISPSADHYRPSRDTKRAQVLAMLSRPEGASGPQIAEAMGWAPHTVRGFLAGLAKKGITVEVVERVRQVGPNRTGAKGSYTVYRIADASRSRSPP